MLVRRVVDLTPHEVSAWEAMLSAEPNLRRAFMSYAYSIAVARNREVLVLLACSGETPCFFLPIQRLPDFPGKLGVFEPVGGKMTDYFGAIACEGTRVDMTTLLDATRGVVNGIVFSHLDETQSRFGLTGAETRVGLRTRVKSGQMDYWTALRTTDKKLVQDTERRERKLVAAYGEMTFEWTSSRPEEDMAWLIEAKKTQYLDTGRSKAPLFASENIDLLKTLLDVRENACQGVLSVLRCDGGTVAAHFGLRCHEMLHVWFPAFDRKFASYSPGRILFKQMFRAAPEHGVSVFDRGEGDSSAKRDFANEEHRFMRGMWLASGRRGLMARLAMSALWQLTVAQR